MKLYVCSGKKLDKERFLDEHCKFRIGLLLKMSIKSIISVQIQKELYITISLLRFFHRKAFV